VGTQRELPLLERNWGGKRKGAGRKPKAPHPWGNRPGVPHLERAEIERRHPVHITLRLMPEVYNLRSRRSFRALEQALFGVRDTGARLTHYSVQGNHVHLILEVEHRQMLTRAMRSLCIRAAKRLNAMMGRTGRVIADRYHAEVLRTPKQVLNAIRYVLSNTRKHLIERGEAVGPITADDYAAGPAEHVPKTMRLRPSALLLEPRTWLLRAGWMRAVA
jgi:REP element-mobilizing transposase RayT